MKDGNRHVGYDRDEERQVDFYNDEERRALDEIGSGRSPGVDLEERIIGVLRRRGLLEPRREPRARTPLGAWLVPFLRPALVALAVTGAFLLGRVLSTGEGGDSGTLVSISPSQLPSERLDESRPPSGSVARDDVPQRLVVLGDEDRRYEYYVDEKGQNYYVLIKLPIPAPIVEPGAESDPPARLGGATAQRIPAMRNSRFEYYFDTHGNAYGVVARDHPAADLFASR